LGGYDAVDVEVAADGSLSADVEAAAAVDIAGYGQVLANGRSTGHVKQPADGHVAGSLQIVSSQRIKSACSGHPYRRYAKRSADSQRTGYIYRVAHYHLAADDGVALNRQYLLRIADSGIGRLELF